MKQRIPLILALALLVVSLASLFPATADMNDYQYLAYPYNLWSSCTSRVIRWKVYGDWGEPYAWGKIEKCDGSSFTKSGVAKVVLISTGEVMVEKNYSAGVSTISLTFDPYGDHDIVGRNAYEVRLYPTNDPDTKITGPIDVWAEFATSVEAERDGSRWTEVSVCYGSPGGSSCGSGYYNKQYLPDDGSGPWDFYTQKKDGCSIELADNNPYYDASYRSYDNSWWEISVPVAGMDVVATYTCSSSPTNTPTPTQTSTPTPSPTNLLANPSFEQGNNASPPWKWIDSSCNYYAYRNSSIAADGEYYLATNRNNSSTCRSFYQDVSGRPRPDGTYTFSIKVRSSNGTARQGEIVIWALGGQQEKSSTNFVVNSTSWTNIQTSLRIQRNDHNAIRAEIYIHSHDAIDYYFDDARLSVQGGQTPPGQTPPPPVYDSDQDTISDYDETHGWQNARGWFITDPHAWDTDGGTASDGEEQDKDTVPTDNSLSWIVNGGRETTSVQNTESRYDDALPQIMSRLDQDNLLSIVYRLEGRCERTVSGWPDNRVESRGHHSNYRSLNGIAYARNYIESFLENRGYRLIEGEPGYGRYYRRQEFLNLQDTTCEGANCRLRVNYVVCLSGNCSDGDGTPIYLITAHYDSIAESFGIGSGLTNGEIAPGADDNASGVAAAMAIAEIFRDYDFEREVRLVLFDGEEEWKTTHGTYLGALGLLGKLGSQEYIKYLQDYEPLVFARIERVINIDMIGSTSLDHRVRLRCVQDGEWSYRFQSAADIVSNRSVSLTIDPIPGECSASDHYSFYSVGKAAVQVRDTETRYHTQEDTSDRSILSDGGQYYHAVAQTVAIVLAEWAGVQGKTQNWPYPLRICEPDNLYVQSSTSQADEPIVVGDFREMTVDLDADGLVDILRIMTTVTTTTPATYTFGASLCAPGLDASSNYDEYQIVGTREIALDFYGQDLYQAYVDGNLSLCEMRAWSSMNPTISWQWSDLYTTSQHYHWSNFEPAGLRLGMYHTEQVIDDDGDGYYNRLNVAVPVQVRSTETFSNAVANTVHYVGYLRTQEGTVITLDEQSAVLSVGTASLPLEFSGLSLFNAAQDGPYALSVHIYTGSEEETRVDDMDRIYQSQIYTAGQFEPPSVVFTGDFIDYGLDLDGNGQFDRLVLEAQVDVTNPGNYTFSADLTKDLVRVAPWTIVTRTLQVGTSTISFFFDGGAIGASGMDAPYTLETVKVFDGDTSELIQNVKNAYTTTIYSAGEFVESTTGITVVETSNLNASIEFDGSWGPFELATGESKRFVNLGPGLYSVSQVPASTSGISWTLLGVTCRDTSGDSVPVEVDLGNFAATIPLQDAQQLTCTFRNKGEHLFYLPIIVK